MKHTKVFPPSLLWGSNLPVQWIPAAHYEAANCNQEDANETERGNMLGSFPNKLLTRKGWIGPSRPPSAIVFLTRWYEASQSDVGLDTEESHAQFELNARLSSAQQDLAPWPHHAEKTNELRRPLRTATSRVTYRGVWKSYFWETELLGSLLEPPKVAKFSPKISREMSALNPVCPVNSSVLALGQKAFSTSVLYLPDGKKNTALMLKNYYKDYRWRTKAFEHSRALYPC